MKNNITLPKDGLAGLKENYASDAVSGFIVFLLALPLSLGTVSYTHLTLPTNVP
jgi:hypothetical protein